MEGESCSWPGLWKHGEVERHSGWVARCCKPPRYPCGVTVQEDFVITVHNRDANTLWNPEYVLISGRWVNEGGDKGHLIMLSWGDWKVWMCSKSTSLAQSSTLMNCCNKVAPNWSECRPRLVVLLDCMFHPFSFGSSLWDWRTFNDNLLSVWAASSLCLEPTSVQDACLALMNCCFSVCSLKWHCFLKHPYFLVLLKKNHVSSNIPGIYFFFEQTESIYLLHRFHLYNSAISPFHTRNKPDDGFNWFI